MRAPWELLVAALLVAPGCATHSRLDALSTERVPVLGYQAEGAQRIPNIAAEVKSQTILWMPTNTKPATLQDAVDAALHRGGGNVLVDVTVDHWWVWVPFLYGQEGWRVQGDVVRAEEPK